MRGCGPFKWGRWAGPLKGGVVWALVVGGITVSDSGGGGASPEGPALRSPLIGRAGKGAWPHFGAGPSKSHAQAGPDASALKGPHISGGFPPLSLTGPRPPSPFKSGSHTEPP